jgi:hypothetical protein
MSFTSPNLQEIARDAYGCAGIVWHVAPSGNDTTNDGQSWDTAVATPQFAAANAVAGDLILLGGMFDVGGSGEGFAPAAGVNVRGGGPSTGITGTLTADGVYPHGALVTIAGRSEFRDFSIIGNVPDGSFQFTLQVASSADAVIRNVPMIGQTDCIYFNGVTNARLRAYDCPLTTKWDAAFMENGSGNTLELYDCPIVSVGPPTITGPGLTYFSTGIGVLASTGSAVRVYRGSIDASGNATSQTAVHTDSAAVRLYGSNVIVGGTGTLLALKQESAGSIAAMNTAYDPTKASGTITQIGGGAQAVVVAPIRAQVSGTLYVTHHLPRVPAGSAPAFAWTVADAAGAAVNLTGKTVRFVVASVATNVDPFAETETALFKYETGGGGVVISGTSNNVATVQFSGTDTAAHVGSQRYWLVNVTDLQVLASGRLPIVPAALNYP